MNTFFNEYRKELVTALNAIDSSIVARIHELMNEARLNNKQIFILGNGGSAAAASHWVCDFGKGINTENSTRMRIFSLADNLSVLTAIGNDFSYEDTFSEQFKNYLNPHDVVISLSVSGNSPNLINAHNFAHEKGAKTIAIIGNYNGKLASCSDVVLTIASKNYGIVEDIHMTVDHAISQYIKKINTQEESI